MSFAYHCYPLPEWGLPLREAVGALIFPAQREMAFVFKRSRHLTMRQQPLSWAYLHERSHSIFCQPSDEGHEVTLPNEAYTARAASSTGKNAETAGEILPLTETSICRRRMGSTSPVVAMRASTTFVGAISCLVTFRAFSQYA